MGAIQNCIALVGGYNMFCGIVIVVTDIIVGRMNERVDTV